MLYFIFLDLRHQWHTARKGIIIALSSPVTKRYNNIIREATNETGKVKKIKRKIDKRQL